MKSFVCLDVFNTTEHVLRIIASNSPSPFFVIMGNNFSYMICMGLFCLWNLWIYQTNQIRNPCIVTIKTLGKSTLKNVSLKLGLTSSCSATQSDTKVSIAGETEDVVSSTKEKRECLGRTVMAAWQWLSFAMQYYLPSHKCGKACIWNCFILASLAGCLLTYNSLLLMTTLRPYKNKLHIFSVIPLYVRLMTDVISEQLNLKTSPHQARLVFYNALHGFSVPGGKTKNKPKLYLCRYFLLSQRSCVSMFHSSAKVL